MTTWLATFLGRQGAAAGTVHLVRGELLEISAAVNIPPKVQEITARIPRGKGMAGLAWERGVAVSTCNLKEDRSGDVRPGAKAVDARAAVAFPVRDGDGADIGAIVGIAFADERDLDDAQLDAIAADAADFPWRAARSLSPG
jgi:hypothetical protein